MGVNQSASVDSYTVVERVQHWAESAPDRELFVFYNGQNRDAYTSRQLFQLAGKFANRLRHQYGFKRYDVIANTLPNSPERLITDLGITLAGCIVLNGQILLADGDDFFESAKISRCSGVVLSSDGNTPAWRLLKPFVTTDGSSDTVSLSCDRAPELTTAILASRHAEGLRKPLLEDLKSNGEDTFVEQSVVPEDLLYVFATSGSTGYSKLVPMSHIELFQMWDGVTKSAHASFGTSSEDVYYNDRQLGWGGGFPFGTYFNGEKRVLTDVFEVDRLRTIADLWRAITQEKSTCVVSVPLDIDNLLKHVKNLSGNFNKLRILGVGGQPLKKTQLEQMFSIAEKILLVYGSTESGYIALGAIRDPDHFSDFLCGKPLENRCVRIVDDEGEDCKPRQVGSVQTKGTGVFRGYFNRLEDPDPKTASAFTEDGWFHTEDNGFFDEDGNIYIIGRHKDIITYGGIVVYPGWLEAKISTHPDVAEACVLPVSDPVLYHNICACVKSKPGGKLTEDTLRAYCESIYVADIHQSSTPMPKFFMVLNSFPTIATGKTDKVTLRQMAEEKFGFKGNAQ